MKRFIFGNILPYMGLALVKMLSATYRIKVQSSENETAVAAANKQPIYISWHQRFFPGITFLSKRKPIAIMVSRSKDGDLISRIIEVFGWQPVRGSSSRGGAAALNQIRKLSQTGCSLAHIVDGPRGPFGEVKPGIMMMAKTSGMPILPVIISSERKWTFGSWDKFMIPKPFSKVIIRFGEAIHVAKDADKHELEKERLALQNDLAKKYKELDASWG